MLQEVSRRCGIETKGGSIHQIFSHILRSIADGYSHILYWFTLESELPRCIEQVLDGMLTFGSSGKCCTQGASRTILAQNVALTIDERDTIGNTFKDGV